jgi:hypothetical protein
MCVVIVVCAVFIFAFHVWVAVACPYTAASWVVCTAVLSVCADMEDTEVTHDVYGTENMHLRQ